MEKRTYQKLFSCWWLSLETEADNTRVNPSLFTKTSLEKSPSKNPEPHSAPLRLSKPTKPLATVNKEQTPTQNDYTCHKPELNFYSDSKSAKISTKCVENCNIIKEAVQKLKHFLAVSHRKGCTDPNCVYNESVHRLKVTFKANDVENGLVKIPKKRGRKSKLEMQQEELA